MEPSLSEHSDVELANIMGLIPGIETGYRFSLKLKVLQQFSWYVEEKKLIVQGSRDSLYHVISKINLFVPGTVFFSSELSESRLLGEVRLGVFFVFSVSCGGVLGIGKILIFERKTVLSGKGRIEAGRSQEIKEVEF